MSMRIQVQRNLAIALLVAGSALAHGGQGEPQGSGSVKHEVIVKKTISERPMGLGEPVGLSNGMVAFRGGEFLFDGKVVKGAPYSAQAVTEFTQVLGDGNRIVRKTAASIARDSEGRTRREQSLEGLGPWSSANMPPTVFINDPVAGVRYMLETDNHKATKISGGNGLGVQITETVRNGERVRTFSAAGASEGAREKEVNELKAKIEKLKAEERVKEGEEQTESLGEQVIEGVQAQGSRKTSTIPAGQIGNDQPIRIVSEAWYSPELQAVVMSKRSDPRMGETVYKLTNINRSEPAPSLFEVPSDYTVVDEQATARQRKELERKMKAVKEETK